jgi:hypothetical protein
MSADAANSLQIGKYLRNRAPPHKYTDSSAWLSIFTIGPFE